MFKGYGKIWKNMEFTECNVLSTVKHTLNIYKL